jgi:hypothetical protein
MGATMNRIEYWVREARPIFTVLGRQIFGSSDAEGVLYGQEPNGEDTPLLQAAFHGEAPVL